MIHEGWSWSDLQDLTFPQLNMFADLMNERLEQIARASKPA
jgi:hypothetical protein